ncbi:50S ribosomal protein L25/general stress protein Ctc [Bowmanella sp. JS7-9]|jgi:large subunit ribosomal protein L25|uniref:Large ribosomal subunit protein bL25 n=1 Tax=Pseudobowmanella zhangzhouensis TaxID=1537679 RepID=A0ABW1XJE4_9ALTE|nr:50S ribosomal protein L25/general stress protein Ctc [Bowmanella sp. JS7-9]TBX27417.1 50S ribosomal protein L25 [Bowmanella sp. JS7-9]
MSQAIFNLDAVVRTDLGKGASRRLRHEDKVPAILYGAGKEPVALTLEHNEVIQAQEFEAFYSHVLTLNIGGEKVEALVKDMQRHAYKPKVTHIDFLRVDATHAVTVTVPLHFINEATSKGVKEQGGHAEHHLADVQVSCLAADLPEFIEVDLQNVELGHTVHLSELTLPKGVTLVELAKGADHDQAVVTIKAPKGGAAEETSEEAAE